MDNATTMRSAYERINAGDIDGFGALLADDFIEHAEVPGLPPTKEGVITYFRSLLTSFPDMQMNVEDLIASGNKAVARVKATATHQGEFMGVPPTGNAVAIQLIDIMSFDDAGVSCASTGGSPTCCPSCSNSAAYPLALRHSRPNE